MGEVWRKGDQKRIGKRIERGNQNLQQRALFVVGDKRHK